MLVVIIKNSAVLDDELAVADCAVDYNIFEKYVKNLGHANFVLTIYFTGFQTI